MGERCVLTGMFVEIPDSSLFHSPLMNRKEPEKKTWCGRDVEHQIEWLFTDASHAALNGRNGGTPKICPKCRAAIVEALNRC